MIAERTSFGVTTEYYYSGTKLVKQRIGTDENEFYYDAAGRPYAMTYNGDVYYYIVDVFGDVLGIYDKYGTVVTKYVYDAWGYYVDVTGSMYNTVGYINPLRYRGYFFDEETGYYFLQSRWYEPETRRFLSADSYMVAGDHINSTNMFAYCLNNPVMYVDPSGREAGNDNVALAVTGLVLLYGLDMIGFSLVNNLIDHYYVFNNNDGVALFEATVSVWNSIAWIAEKYNTGTSFHGLEDAASRTALYATTIANVISESAIELIVKFFSEEKIDLLFLLYGDAIQKEYDKAVLEAIERSAITLAGVATASSGSVLGILIALVPGLIGLKNPVDNERLWTEIMRLKT